jgi:hypothetical protein
MTRYIKVFDEDRSDLASAYSCNAVFSCRMHEMRPAITSSSLGLRALAANLTSPDASGGSSHPHNFPFRALNSTTFPILPTS